MESSYRQELYTKVELLAKQVSAESSEEKKITILYFWWIKILPKKRN